MRSELWLLIDAGWVCHQAFYAIQNLAHEDKPTGVIFGVLEHIRLLSAEWKTNRIAFFFDSRRSFRRKAFPGYKEGRKKRTPEQLADSAIMHEQIQALRREILPTIGFPCFMQVGLEADDLIAMAASQLDSPWTPEPTALMITNDGDLYQCITDSVWWLNPTRHLQLNPTELWVKTGAHPDEWCRIKSIAGCRSDSVPGVRGVGEKTAVAYLHGALSCTSKKYMSITSDEGHAIIKRNMELVRLPHYKTRQQAMTPPVYSREGFDDVCKQYGLHSYTEPPLSYQWDRLLSGRVGARPIPRKRGEPRGERHAKR